MADYWETAEEFERAWAYLKKVGRDGSREVANMRAYGEEMLPVLQEAGILGLPGENEEFEKLKKLPLIDSLGLFSEKGNFLLSERWVLPIRGILGEIVALVGWNGNSGGVLGESGDPKKYITTSSEWFKRDMLYYGMEKFKDYWGQRVFITEGMFDCLALRGLGFNAIAMMGVETSQVKKELLGVFSDVVFVPDNDKTGRRVLQNKSWGEGGKWLRWTGTVDLSELYEGIEVDGVDLSQVRVKDIDTLVRLFPAEELRDEINTAVNRKSINPVKVLTF